jgi:hypothetical protein
MTESNVESVSPEEQTGVLAMAQLEAERDYHDWQAEAQEIAKELPGLDLAPQVYGGTTILGNSRMEIVIPPGSPVDVRRLWVRVGATVAAEALAVGLPIEGETIEGFVALLEERTP